MKKYLIVIGILVFPIVDALAIFDRTIDRECTYQVTCPDGTSLTVHEMFIVCGQGWGLCGEEGHCGELTIRDICGEDRTGGGGGGGSMPDECLFDPFHCDPFPT